MRLAVLLVPDFPLQALRRSVPELAEAPLAVAAGASSRDLLVAVAAEAEELGVRAGMTVAQARTRAPAVLVRVTPPEVAAAASEALADVALSFTPRIRRQRPGELLLDASGLTPRWGSEEAIAGALLRACRRVGLEARVGIANAAGVARVAAGSGEAVVVQPGHERAFLGLLPIALLDPPPALAATLTRWGIATAGELACLPRGELALRLGREGVALHQLACGEESASFIPDPVREALREGIVLEDSLSALESFLFVLHGLLSRLAARLDLRGEGFAEVLLELQLEGGERRDYRVKLVAPTREVGTVLAMVRLQLEAHPPGAPVEGTPAQVTPGRVRMMQASLFAPPLPAPGKLALILARLAALVGPERFGAPSLPDTHRPSAWALAPFAPVNEDGARGSGLGVRENEDGARGSGLGRTKTELGVRGSGVGGRKSGPGARGSGGGNRGSALEEAGKNLGQRPGRRQRRSELGCLQQAHRARGDRRGGPLHRRARRM
ncbi:MAG: DNA polymerase Y family protein, partial [Acidobacteriota bacterium]